jgi:hypothetical protein
MIPVETQIDKKIQMDQRELEEKTGLRGELLASKKTNEKILRKLTVKKLKVARHFALKWCVADKFRKTGLVPKVRALDIEAINEALSLLRGNTLYLYWKQT